MPVNAITAMDFAHRARDRLLSSDDDLSGAGAFRPSVSDGEGAGGVASLFTAEW
jgi:hypothetical protein